MAAALERALPGIPEPISLLRLVRLHARRLDLILPDRVHGSLAACLPNGHTAIHSPASGETTLSVPVHLPLRGGRRTIAVGEQDGHRDPKLIAALRRAHAMLQHDQHGHPVVDAAPVSPYEGRLLRLAFLAPDLQRDILAGRQPAHISLEFLMKREIPLSWSRQREALWQGKSSAPVMAK